MRADITDALINGANGVTVVGKNGKAGVEAQILGELMKNWTEDKPTEAGFYWFAEYAEANEGSTNEKPPTVVKVSSTFGLPFQVAFVGTPYVSDLAALTGKWSARIKEPD